MNSEPFVYWAAERENIRVKKERGDSWPWTDDQILQEYKFCCTRRSDDRVSRWIVEKISDPYADNPNLWFMLCISRTLNWPDTLQELITTGVWPKGKAFNPAIMSTVLQRRVNRGEKTFTGAYIVKAESAPSVPWYNWKKTRYIAEIVLGRLWNERRLIAPFFKTTLQAAHEHLMDFRGWGPFMAWQAIADMAYCRSLLANAPDRNSWAAAGPGTLRGLNRLHERPIKYNLSQTQALDELRELYILLRQQLNFEIDWIDVMNICCETDKYLRLQNGEGSVRAKYHQREAA